MINYKDILKLMLGSSDYAITGEFGEGSGVNGRLHNHGATDFAVPEGTRVRTPETAIVTFEQYGISQTYNVNNRPYTEKEFGNSIIIYIEAWNRSYLLSHLKHKMMMTEKGKTYPKGFVITQTGNTGYSSGAHLHIAVAIGKHSSISSIRKNAIDFEKDIVNDKHTTYINLHPMNEYPKYGYYHLNDVPVAKNIRGYILANKLGGVTYEVVGLAEKNVVIVNTRDFGRVKLYVDDVRASLTVEPKYKVYG